MTRTSKTLIGAAIGACLGLTHSFLIGDPYSGAWYVPQTTAGWVAYYVSYAVPWALIGAAIGFFSGKKTRDARAKNGNTT